MIPVLRKALLPAALLAFAWAVVAALTGGLNGRVAGVVLRARGAYRPLLIGFALLVLYAALNRDAFARFADRAGALLARSALVIALVAAVALFVLAVQFGSFTAGGSDSYGYVSEAYGWVGHELPGLIPLPLTLSTSTSDRMQIPLGYRPGARPHTMVPTYAAGLPLLMALGILLAGPCGPFLIVPICAAVLVYATFVLARRAAGPEAGAVAAIVIATTPVVLFQAMSAMSDVPAGAFWTAALAASFGASRRSALLAGLCAAVGLLIRPNLVPLVIAPVLGAALGQSGGRRWTHAALVMAPAALAQSFIAVLHTAWYGSPFVSGYGRASELYALANVLPNVKLYSVWTIGSESPWVLVGLIALLPFAWRHANRRVIAISVLSVAVTLAAYLAYATFDAWWYLRFLLPAGGAAATLTAVGVTTLARAVPRPLGQLAACATCVGLVTTTWAFASREQIFGGVRDGERHYVEVGEFVSRALPDNAVVFAVQHSGSLRFYGGRMTLRFDEIEKGTGIDAAADIERLGRHPYLVVDDFELPQFRSQFGLPPEAPIPFPLIARMRESGGTTVYDLAVRPAPASPVALEPGRAKRCSGPGLPLKGR